MNMHLHVESFGKFKNHSYELGTVTLFYGPNESGKTTLLDAFRLALCRPHPTLTKQLRERYGKDLKASLHNEMGARVPGELDAAEISDLLAVRSGNLNFQQERGAWAIELQRRLFEDGLDPARIAEDLRERCRDDGRSRYHQKMSLLHKEITELNDTIKQIQAERIALLEKWSELGKQETRCAEITERIAELTQEQIQEKQKGQLALEEWREKKQLLVEAQSQVTKTGSESDVLKTQIRSLDEQIAELEAAGARRQPDELQDLQILEREERDAHEKLTHAQKAELLSTLAPNRSPRAGWLIAIAGTALAAIGAGLVFQWGTTGWTSLALSIFAASLAILIYRQTRKSASHRQLAESRSLEWTRLERAWLDAKAARERWLFVRGAQNSADYLSRVALQNARADLLTGHLKTRQELQSYLRSAEMHGEEVQQRINSHKQTLLDYQVRWGAPPDASESAMQGAILALSKGQQRTLNSLQEDLQKCRESMSHLQGWLQAGLGTLPQRLAEVQEALESKERASETLRREHQAIALAAEIFAGLRTSEHAALHHLVNETHKGYAAFVGYNAPTAQVGIESLNSHSAQPYDTGGSPRHVSQLSSGTQDAFLLSLRLSLSQFLRPQGGMLLFDEPFGAFDATRTRRALEHLAREVDFSRWKLIFLTKDDELKNEVIRIFPTLRLHELTHSSG